MAAHKLSEQCIFTQDFTGVGCPKKCQMLQVLRKFHEYIFNGTGDGERERERRTIVNGECIM